MDDNIVLIFTMHKCGSTTLMETVRKCGLNPGRGYEKNIPDIQPLNEYRKIVIPVRDPVARNVSWMFENFGDEILNSNMSTEDIMLTYAHRFSWLYPLKWFDEIVLPNFGLDVYKHKFPKTKGWTMIGEKYLIIQTERMSDKLSESFGKFLNVPVDNLHAGNTVETRKYGEIYRKFLKEITFTEEYVNSMYDSKYMKHFYSEKDIEKFRKRWINGL